VCLVNSYLQPGRLAWRTPERKRPLRCAHSTISACGSDRSFQRRGDVLAGGGGLPPGLVALHVAEHVQLVVQVLIAAPLHFDDGIGIRPAFVLDAVERAVRAGAVDACEAVDQDRVVGRVVHHGEELLYPPLGWYGAVRQPPLPRGDAEVMKSLRTTILLLIQVGGLFVLRRGVAERHHRAYPVVVDDPLETGETQLAAAIEYAVSHDTEVADVALLVIGIAQRPCHQQGGDQDTE